MSESKPNIIFMGTPEFAVPTLERIHSGFGIKAVVTVPDKPQGRGKKVSPSLVKLKADELSLPVLQPEKLKDAEFIDTLQALNPDIIIVLAFRILPPEVFTLAKIATFNIHASLLPKYRGAAPINWAIINGEKTSGLTSFILEEKVDTGNILLQRAIDIPEGATAGDLHDILMNESPQFAIDSCGLLISSNYKLYKQDNSQATPAPKIFREQCKINWTNHALNLRNFIHGVSPIPGAWTMLGGKIFKILRVEFSDCGSEHPGNFIIEHGNMLVNCGKGIISILEIQQEGKKPMKINEFLLGYRGALKGSFD